VRFCRFETDLRFYADFTRPGECGGRRRLLPDPACSRPSPADRAHHVAWYFRKAPPSLPALRRQPAPRLLASQKWPLRGSGQARPVRRRSLARRRFGRGAQHGAGPWRRDHSSAGMLWGHLSGDAVLVVGTIGRERGGRDRGLLEQGPGLGGVIDLVRGQRRGDDCPVSASTPMGNSRHEQQNAAASAGPGRPTRCAAGSQGPASLPSQLCPRRGETGLGNQSVDRLAGRRCATAGALDRADP